MPERTEEIAGHGIKATLGGREILCGNEKLMTAHGVALPEGLKGSGTRVIVAADGCYVGDLLIADTLKPGAKEAVSRLKAQGLHAAMLTGDAQETAGKIARDTGIDEVRARLLPEEKLTVG